MTPALTLSAMCARRGRAQVVAGCVTLIRGDYSDEPFIRELGGDGAAYILAGHARVDGRYWFRTWGARGLLYVWDDSALPAVVEATSDEHWRVREMAAKVVARHQVDDALSGGRTAPRRPGSPGARGSRPRPREVDDGGALRRPEAFKIDFRAVDEEAGARPPEPSS